MTTTCRLCGAVRSRDTLDELVAEQDQHYLTHHYQPPTREQSLAGIKRQEQLRKQRKRDRRAQQEPRRWR
jgi:hypothetical protein